MRAWSRSRSALVATSWPAGTTSSTGPLLLCAAAPPYADRMRLDDVVALLDALERHGVRYAVFGGLAMAAHGFDRATRDLDLFVAPDGDNIEQLRRALGDVFDDPDIAAITADDLGGEYPAVQYGPPGVDFTIDIVSRLSDAFRFEDLVIDPVALGATTIAVVSAETLYRMKRDTVRLRERDDAQPLVEAFEFDDASSSGSSTGGGLRCR
jgi:hypothetical protein